eukprot:scaffold25415_cov32-Tisochrysis_lutea.AAC.1
MADGRWRGGQGQTKTGFFIRGRGESSQHNTRNKQQAHTQGEAQGPARRLSLWEDVPGGSNCSYSFSLVRWVCWCAGMGAVVCGCCFVRLCVALCSVHVHVARGGSRPPGWARSQDEATAVA